MSNETSKCYSRRYAQGHLQKLKGIGYDIGGGADVLILPHAEVKLWDKKNGNGDAELLSGINENSLDFIYSSHTLEHMRHPIIALERWLDVVKPNGYVYIAVPDFDLYEGGERIKNGFHKCAFSLSKETNENIPLLNIFDLLLNKTRKNKKIHYLGLCDENYDYSLDKNIDQTRKQAVCHIEILLQKQIIDINI